MKNEYYLLKTVNAECERHGNSSVSARRSCQVSFITILFLGQRYVSRCYPRRLFNFCMRTITKRRFFCPFATAKKYLFGFIRRKCNRRKRGALMRAIAEWLLLAQAARTQIIRFPLFNIHCIRRFLCNFRFFHSVISFLLGRITYTQLLFIWFPDKTYLLLSSKIKQNRTRYFGCKVLQFCV